MWYIVSWNYVCYLNECNSLVSKAICCLRITVVHQCLLLRKNRDCRMQSGFDADLRVLLWITQEFLFKETTRKLSWVVQSKIQLNFYADRIPEPCSKARPEQEVNPIMPNILLITTLSTPSLTGATLSRIVQLIDGIKVIQWLILLNNASVLNTITTIWCGCRCQGEQWVMDDLVLYMKTFSYM